MKIKLQQYKCKIRKRQLQLKKVLNRGILIYKQQDECKKIRVRITLEGRIGEGS